ncbi:hypothetical protein EIP86_000091 [Pleurotus ostreatoroseus]|nr:hypothetical protein EIP86_000091 [Pleurotus ostreatoroseus]
MPPLRFTDAAIAALSTWLIWTLLKGVYNLYWHPLAKYPGLKAAAFSSWWKVYQEVVAPKNLVDTLFELHSQYDPVLYHAFAEAESSFSLCDYRRAKARKDILQPFFSRKSIVDMQHLVQDCVEEMCAKIKLQYDNGKSTNVLLAFRCISVDAIMSFCFANSLHALREPNFEAPVEKAMTLALPTVTKIKYLPIIKHFSSICPPALMSFLKPELAGLVQMRVVLRDQVKHVLENATALQEAPHPVIYHALLNPVHGPRPSITSLRDEALLLVFAGTDTASNVLTVGTMHILSKPAIHARLKAEILEAWPNQARMPRFEEMERLPYLTAVIKESLRLSHGPISPMTRIVPKEGAEINGKWVPGGTNVGISSCFVHLNDDIFPDPYTFNPERWLGPEAEGLDHWLVAFSRGPRSCLGIKYAFSFFV